MRTFRLATGARRNDPSVESNAVETLLSALGHLPVYQCKQADGANTRQHLGRLVELQGVR